MKKFYKDVLNAGKYVAKSVNKQVKIRVHEIAKQQKRQLKTKENPWATTF
jgi:hypothetical protein